MNSNVVQAQAHRLHVERIRQRIELAMHRETERNVDVAHDRLDLRIRAAVMTVLDEEHGAAREGVRIAEELARLQATFNAEQSTERQA